MPPPKSSVSLVGELPNNCRGTHLRKWLIDNRLAALEVCNNLSSITCLERVLLPQFRDLQDRRVENCVLLLDASEIVKAPTFGLSQRTETNKISDLTVTQDNVKCVFREVTRWFDLGVDYCHQA